jgi:hypothetical protein
MFADIPIASAIFAQSRRERSSNGTALPFLKSPSFRGARSSREPGIQMPYATAGFRVCVPHRAALRADPLARIPE